MTGISWLIIATLSRHKNVVPFRCRSVSLVDVWFWCQRRPKIVKIPADRLIYIQSCAGLRSREEERETGRDRGCENIRPFCEQYDTLLTSILMNRNWHIFKTAHTVLAAELDNNGSIHQLTASPITHMFLYQVDWSCTPTHRATHFFFLHSPLIDRHRLSQTKKRIVIDVTDTMWQCSIPTHKSNVTNHERDSGQPHNNNNDVCSDNIANQRHDYRLPNTQSLVSRMDRTHFIIIANRILLWPVIRQK